MEVNKIYNIDATEGAKALPDNSINCCVTSPPYYGLRSYVPDMVQLKNNAPQWVLDKLKEMNIKQVSYE